jgi:PAS domain S-box-containing protein
MTLQRSPAGIFVVCSLVLIAAAAVAGTALEQRGVVLPGLEQAPTGVVLGAGAGLLVVALALRGLGRQDRRIATVGAELRGLMETVPDGLLILGAHERVLLANEPAARLFGFQREELVGQAIGQLLPQGIRELIAGAARLHPAADAAAGDVVGQRKNGDECTLEARLRPVRTGRGHVYALFLRDPTDRRRAEASFRQTEESLRQAEAKFRSIFEHAAEGIFQATPKGRFITVNPALARMLGYSSPQELMDKVTDIKRQVFVDPGRRSEIRALSERSGVARGFELQAYRKDGTKVWLMGNQRVVHDAAGRVLYYEGNFEDITERKRTEEALRESQRAISTLLSNLPGMAYRGANDHDRTMEFVSEGAFELTGYYPDKLVANRQKAYGQVIHPADRETVWNEVQTALRAGRPYQIGYRVETARGEVRTVWEQGRGVYSTDGARFVLEGFVIDVTERVRAEEKLRRSEERFRQLAENIRGVFWMTDPEMKELFYVNSAYEEIWGRTRDSLFKAPLSRLDAVDDKDRPRVQAAIRKAADGKYDEEYCIVRHDGSVRWIWDRAFPILDEHGKVYRLAGIAEDITERKRLAEELRQAQKMEAVGRLAGGIAHDFNNLLTVVIGYCQVLLANLPAQDQWRPCVGEMKKAADRAADLTQQLLAFSRKQVLRPVVLDLNALVAGMKDMIQRLIGEDIRLETTLEPALGHVEADPGQLQQILMNLIVNARDAMPKGGKLTILTANIDLTEADLRGDPDCKPGPYALVAVRDTGIGMDAETRARLFEPFFTTKEVGKGTGLGLSMVYGIVKQSKGYVEVETALGRGSSFRIYLPRIASEVERISPAEAAPVAPLARGKETLLLVEDEELVRRMTRTILQRSGYTVLEAKNGHEALHVAEQQPRRIDLLLTDVVMPGMNGRELYQRLARIRPDVKVLFMSGYTDSALLRNGVLESGITLVLKPFAPEALLTHVREVLDREPGPNPKLEIRNSKQFQAANLG